MSEDHAHAKAIAETIGRKGFVKEVLPVETNIIIFEIDETLTAEELVRKLKEKGLLAYAISPRRIRLVVHLDITPGMVEETIKIFGKL